MVITLLGSKALNIPLDSSGLFSILTANVIRSSEILNHGCVCSNFGVSGINSQIGNPDTLDVIDSICRQWKTARRCLRMSGGACELNDLTGFYVLNASCEAAADTCDGACCEVDIFYVNLINEALASDNSWTAEAPTDAKCPFSFGTGVRNNACCGTAPDVHMYNSNTGDCSNAGRCSKCQDISTSHTWTSSNEGSYEEVWYTRYASPKRWNEAKGLSVCPTLGSGVTIAKVLSVNEDNLVNSLDSGLSWMGLHCRDGLNHRNYLNWSWTDHSGDEYAVTYEDGWDDHANFGGLNIYRRCVILNQFGTGMGWIPWSCTHQLPVLCECRCNQPTPLP